MTSSTPTSKSKSEQQTPAVAAPVGLKPEKLWWRRWMEPILVVTIVAALLTALVTGGAVAFQSLKGDIHASEARVSARIDRLAVRIGTVEASLREDIRAVEANLHEEIKTVETSLREDIRAVETSLHEEIKTVEANLREDIRAVEASLHEEIKTVEASLHEDIQASEARQNRRIVELKEEIQASEARQNQQIVELKEEIQASEARQNQRIDELRQDNAELKADLRVMDNKLDRVLEALLAASPEMG